MNRKCDLCQTRNPDSRLYHWTYPEMESFGLHAFEFDPSIYCTTCVSKVRELYLKEITDEAKRFAMVSLHHARSEIGKRVSY